MRLVLCSHTTCNQNSMGLRQAWYNSLNTGEVFVCFDGILTLQTQLCGGRVVSLLGGRTHTTNKKEIFQDTAQMAATYKQGHIEPPKVDASDQRHKSTRLMASLVSCTDPFRKKNRRGLGTRLWQITFTRAQTSSNSFNFASVLCYKREESVTIK